MNAALDLLININIFGLLSFKQIRVETREMFKHRLLISIISMKAHNQVKFIGKPRIIEKVTFPL